MRKFIRRIGRRKVDRVVFGLAIVGVIALFVYMGACDTEGPTVPDPVVNAPTPTTPVVTATTPETPTVTPTPEPGSNGPGPLSYEGSDCKGTVTNSSSHAKWMDVKYTAPLNNDIEHLKVRYQVPGGGTFDPPSAQSVFNNKYDFPKPSCEPFDKAMRVQCDGVGGVGSGGAYHIFGQFADVKLHLDAIKDEPVGEPDVQRDRVCGEEIQTDGERCWLDCVLTITRTQKYTCSEPKVEVKSEDKRMPVDCPCKETGPVDVAGAFEWFGDNILEGRCIREVFPLDLQVSTGTRKDCHIVGVQDMLKDFICEDDTRFTRDLCKNVVCPTPGFCHVENFDFGSWKWQCQNQPPGTPGHSGHQYDFEGPCTEDKCYRITN